MKHCALVLLTLVTACGGSDQTDVSSPENGQSAATDITDVLLLSREADCSKHAGDYVANVKDVARGQDFVASVSITVSGDSCQLSSNEIPNHNFNDGGIGFINTVREQSGSYSLQSNSMDPQGVTALDLGTTNAVFLNGVTLDLLAAACYGVGNEPLGEEKIGCGGDQIDNPWRYDPMSSLNDFGTDSHNAHAQPDGTYHYHGNPRALFEQDCELTGEPSPVIGYAADGYPIYGSCYRDPNTGNVVKASSSYRLRNNGGLRQEVVGYTTPVAGNGSVKTSLYDGQFRGDWEFVEGAGVLDECNGMTVDGQYGYYVTDAYPWVMGCFKGGVNTSFIKSVPAMLNTLHLHSPKVQ